jgi:glycerol-3-phosphate acyltransferase PlsY
MALKVLALAAAYLLGSIPFSYLVARSRGVDVRKVGSGNVGATNVMRSAGRWPGPLAFALDFLKGAAATFLAGRLLGGDAWPSAAAILAVIGHMYPVWLGFRGGKGVATGAGAFLPVALIPTLAALAIFAVVSRATRYVSIGSICGAAGLGLVSFLMGRPPAVWAAAAAVAVLITWKHRGNLQRITAGTERRMGSPRPAGGP